MSENETLKKGIKRLANIKREEIFYDVIDQSSEVIFFYNVWSNKKIKEIKLEDLEKLITGLEREYGNKYMLVVDFIRKHSREIFKLENEQKIFFANKYFSKSIQAQLIKGWIERILKQVTPLIQKLDVLSSSEQMWLSGLDKPIHKVTSGKPIASWDDARHIPY